ncbi:MAG TPA: Asp-tRNA(Asn)/Glu-tRNA(Gln) amidotransferase subunit GatA [Sediminibacterium sp.]|nr:Asp-tRNA(Asn)/Glu-tRNA(Gln) amidotransferase subunit GatA [Sediminibacterium sp.]
MFRYSTIKDYHSALKNGQTTCVEAVRFYADAIREKASLNAFLEVYEAEALERATLLDQHIQQGGGLLPLHGVIVGLKDVISHQAHALTAASRILTGFKALYHATAVERLLEAGAIIIGRQNCDEFAMGSSNENSAWGPVRNALDERRVSGGSSGGSAVAVQAGLCMISLGSDTGGSVRQPADFCGVVGLKPSYGRVSRYGLIAYASSFDQIGIFSNSVPDAAAVLEIIAGADAFDSTVSPQAVPAYTADLEAPAQTFRFGYFPEALEHPGLDPVIREKMQSYFEELRSAGHRVEPIAFPLLNQVVPAYYVLTTAEASSNLSRYDGVRFGFRAQTENADLAEMYAATRTQGFGKEVQRRILLGTFVLSAGYFDAYYTKAQQVRQLLYRQTKNIFEHVDALLSPTVPSPAFLIGEKINDPVGMFLADIYTVYANLVGIPGISLPLFRHTNGMPFGLQVMSAPFSEVSLLQVSRQLMEAGTHATV